MKKYAHGGDVYAKEHCELIDFSANINPLGLPTSVKETIIAAVDDVVSYPDPFCRKLISAISQHEKVVEETIICGNGVSDILFKLTLAYTDVCKGKIKALIPAPTFTEYEEAVKLVGGEVIYHSLLEEEGFELTAGILDAIESGVDEGLNMVFICNPNNPTGLAVSGSLLDEIEALCCKKKILLVLDECFLDLAEGFSYLTKVSIAAESEYLMVLKAFTKTFAMPGLRLGYAISGNSKLLDTMFMAGQPWSVNTLAQAAGVVALNDEAYVDKSRKYIAGERKRLIEALRDFGAEVTSGATNYIFFKVESGREFYSYMMGEGFLIRSCSNFVGLDNRYFRIAVRTEKENDAFIEALANMQRRKDDEK